MAKSAEIYEKDYSGIWVSLFITCVVCAVFAFAVALSDSFTKPISASLGATSAQIEAASNLTFVQKHWISLCFWPPAIFIIAYLGWIFCEYPPGYRALLPNKIDCCGYRKLKKR